MKTCSWLRSQSVQALGYTCKTSLGSSGTQGSHIPPLDFHLSPKNYVVHPLSLGRHLTPEAYSTAPPWCHTERGLNEGRGEQVTEDATQLLTASQQIKVCALRRKQILNIEIFTAAIFLGQKTKIIQHLFLPS